MLEKILPNQQREYGFTMLDMMVGMLIIGIMGSLAAIFFVSTAPDSSKKGIVAEKFYSIGETLESWSVSHPDKKVPATDGYLPYSQFERVLSTQGIVLNGPAKKFDDNTDFLKIDRSGESDYTICGYPKSSTHKDKKASYVYDSATGEYGEDKQGLCQRR